MLALQKTHPEFGLSLHSVTPPSSPAADEVLIQVAAVGICGSDVHVYEWTESYAFMRHRLPIILGHEFSGVIKQIGAHVTDLHIDMPVAVMPGISCMRCDHCLNGELTLCADREVIGLTRHGAFAPYVNVPARACLPLPPDIDLKLAALLEPLCIGDNATEVGDIQPGNTVLILGPGTIGQAIARCASWKGATQIIVVGKNDKNRLDVALQVGASHVIDIAKTPDLSQEVFAITQGKPVDVVIEATGHASSIKEGLALLRQGGVFVVAGIHAQAVNLDLTSLVRKKQQLRGAHGSHRKAWQRMIQRLYLDPDAVRPMVSMELNLHDALEGFEHCRSRSVSKVLLIP